MYTKEDRKELDRKRGLIREAIQRCDINGFDARPLLDPYKRICEELWKIGGRPETPPYCRPENWENPVKWANQAKCKNPVVGVTDDFTIIRERPIAPMKPKKVTIDRPVETHKLEPAKQATSTIQNSTPKKELESGYYKINISWTEKPDVNRDSISKLQFIFNELGLKQAECHELNNGYTVEKTIEYIFKGSKDAFIMLKQTAMATLDALAGNQEFNILIHGKRIDYEIDT